MRSPARLLELCLLAGEAAWITAALTILAPVTGQPDSFRLFPGVVVLLGGGYTVATLAARLAVAGVDRWLVSGLGILVAMSAPWLLGLPESLLSGAGATVWVIAVVIWTRGVVLGGGQLQFQSVGVSFMAGFAALTAALALPVGTVHLGLAVLFCVTYLAAFALATLERVADTAGEQLGSEWLAVALGAIATAAAAGLAIVGAVGPLVEEPLRRGLTAALGVVLTVLVLVLTQLAYLVGLAGQGLLELLRPLFPELPEVEPQEPGGEPIDPAQILSSLPPWLQVALQVLVVVLVVLAVAGVIALAYRRRPRQAGGVRPAHRASVFRSGLLREELFGWLQRGEKAGPARPDPLEAFGADGRWLRTHYRELHDRVAGPEQLTPRRVVERAGAEPGLAEVAPVAAVYEAARFGLRRPEPPVMADLRRRWGRGGGPGARPG